MLTPNVRDRENNSDKSFWTGTKRFNASHFISETGQVSSFSDELHDWQNFLPAVQLEVKQNGSLEAYNTLSDSHNGVDTDYCLCYTTDLQLLKGGERHN